MADFTYNQLLKDMAEAYHAIDKARSLLEDCQSTCTYIEDRDGNGNDLVMINDELSQFACDAETLAESLRELPELDQYIEEATS